MKGLLLKDFYQTVKYCRAYLVLVLVFLAVPLFSEDSMFFLVYPCVFAGMIPVTLLGYDERSRWLQYSETLPYTKAQIVSAKYLIGLAAQVLILVLAVASQAGRMATTGSFSGKELLALMTVLLVVSCVTSSITLPFMFKWGVEKGRIAYNIMIGVGCLSGLVAANMLQAGAQMQVNAGLPALCAAAIGIYALSWYLSIRFYQKREIK